MKTIEEIDLKSVIENEVGRLFNRENKMCSPFNPTDDTPSFGIYFDSNNNKWKYKDFSTNEPSGDAIDFIMKFRNLDYNQAREWLGIEVEKTDRELEMDKVKSYIEWQINNRSDFKAYRLIGLFQFVDKDNNPLYYKAKILKPNGKKITPYYHIEGEKVINTRGYDEVIYNLNNVFYGIANNKPVVIVEGEKDANTINSMLKSKGYVATSLKGVKDLEVLKNEKAKIIVVGDTGEAGKNYIEHIRYELFSSVKSFKIVTLPGLKALGDNKDVTDWIEAGHDKKELLMAFKKSLDLKDKSLLQQDDYGIYKTKFKKDEDGNYIEDGKIRYTDFNLISAYRLNMIEEEKEGIKLKLRSFSGREYEKVGNSNIFNDIRSFRNFLGTMDLNFMQDKTKDVVDLGKWINDFWAIDNQEIYKGVQFKPIGDKLALITQDGSITTELDNLNVICNLDNAADRIEMLDTPKITKEEMKELREHIINFIPREKAITVLGTIINNLCVYQAEKSKIKLHHLLIVGESGSGKSDVLSKYIAPILGIQNIKGVGNTTAWAMDKDLTTGNYTSLYDEFKPSMFTNQGKMKNISDTLRSLFDRSTISKGGKDFKVRNYTYRRPIVIAGEESYPNSETALITRSAIIYISPDDRTTSSTESYEWICDNEEILNKLGRSLIDMVLNLPIDEYKTLREKVGKLFSLKNRPLNTAINIATGIMLFNGLLVKLGLRDLAINDFVKAIESNIKEEVLDGGEDTNSIVEQMLLLYNDMASNGRIPYFNDIVRRYKTTNYLLIRTSEMITEIHEFCRRTGSAELIPLKVRDFNKQALKSKYKLKQVPIDGSKRDRISVSVYSAVEQKNKSTWFDIYDLNKFRELGCDSLAPLNDNEVKVKNEVDKTYKINNIYNDDALQEEMPF